MVFFNAIISAPNLIKPSQWLPFIWGKPEVEPVWENKKAYEIYMSSVMVLYNRVANDLSGFTLEPLLRDDDAIDPISSGQIWASGYRVGMQLWDASHGDLLAISEPMSKIMAHAEHGVYSDELDGVEEELNVMLDAVMDIHEYFLTQRQKNAPAGGVAAKSAHPSGNKRGVTKPMSPRLKVKNKKKLH